MTTTTDKKPKAPDPYEEPLAGAGITAILVPLIIGGAIVAAAIILWNTHTLKLRVAEAARIEELVRGDIRDAYRKVRYFAPFEALVCIREAEKKLGTMRTDFSVDYPELRIIMLIIESESEFMLDAAGSARDVESQLTEAMSLMTRASGELWQVAVFGRARARIELERWREAEEDLSLLLDRNDSFGAAYYWRSLARRSLGDAAGAESDEERARALDSWPPLRDYMQPKDEWVRDILSEPEVRVRAGKRQDEDERSR